jgi:phage virion morphogenesis protein
LLQKLDSRGRAQLARKAAQQLRRSQQQRIRAQVNPDGSPYVPRKPRHLRGKKGRIKGRMFEKLKMARYLKAKGTPQQAVTGFAGRVSRVARVHQHGLKDRAERDAPKIRYAKRQLLGISPEDLQEVRELIIDTIIKS